MRSFFTLTQLEIGILPLIVLFGLTVGSFLNVVIYRLPNKISIAFPNSHCPKCKHSIKFYDNIPVVSYIILGGKCRYCKEKISIIYPTIELLNTVLWVFCFFAKRISIETLFLCLLSSALICVAVIDLQTMTIPDPLCIFIFSVSVIKLIADIIINKAPIDSLIDFALGAFSGSCFLLALYFLVLKVFKKEGLGGGDVKLTFAVGALIGWKATLFGIGLSAYIGIIFAIILILIGHRSVRNGIPFGPMLSAGFLIGALFAEPVISWYLSTF